MRFNSRNWQYVLASFFAVQALTGSANKAHAIRDTTTNNLSSIVSTRDWVGQVASLQNLAAFQGDAGTGFLVQTPYSQLQGRLAVTAAHVLKYPGHANAAHRFTSPKTYRTPGLGIVSPTGVDVGLILFPNKIDGSPPVFSSGYSPLVWNALPEALRPAFTVIGGETSTTIREGIAGWSGRFEQDSAFVLKAQPHKTAPGDSGGPTLLHDEILSIHWQASTDQLKTTFNETRVDKGVGYFDWIQGNFINSTKCVSCGGGAAAIKWPPVEDFSVSQWSLGEFKPEQVVDLRTNARSYEVDPDTVESTRLNGLVINRNCRLELKIVHNRSFPEPPPSSIPVLVETTASGILNSGVIELVGAAIVAEKLDNVGVIDISDSSSSAGVIDDDRPALVRVKQGIFNEGGIRLRPKTGI